MAISTKSVTFGPQRSTFLLHPDHYVNIPQTIEVGDPAAVTIDGRQIVQAGTIWPANDATARGIVFYDVDITDDDAASAALMVHGFVRSPRLPEEPSAAAMEALKLIYFSTPLA